MMARREWPRVDHIYLLLLVWSRFEVTFTSHTITCSGVVVAYHNLKSSTLHKGGSIIRNDAVTTVNYNVEFQALGFTTPCYPHCFFRHCLASRFQPQSIRTDTSELQFRVLKCSLNIDKADVSKVLSTYVSLSVRSCIYNSESKIVLCPSCWVCYWNNYVHELKLKKRSQPRRKPLKDKNTHNYLWSAIILFQCLLFLQKVLSQRLSHRWHLGSCQRQNSLQTGFCSTFRAHLWDVTSLVCDTLARLLTYLLLELNSDWVSCHWKLLLCLADYSNRLWAPTAWSTSDLYLFFFYLVTV